MRKRLTVRFRDFWPHFDPRHFFLPLLQGIDAGLEPVLVERGPVDVELVSVFPPPEPWQRPARRALARRLPAPWRAWLDAPRPPSAPAADARVSIWFTGENQRPALGAWDLRLSFDADSTRLANRYLPLWWLQFPELLAPCVPVQRGEQRLGRPLTLDEVLAPRPATRAGRERFACAFIGNPEPLRLQAVQALSAIGPVDVYGAAVGRPVRTKQEVSRRYRFELCFENSFAPGYVTEKAFDAWGGGAVPLWCGLDPHGFLNPLALVNYAALPGMDEFCARVEQLDRDPAAWEAIASQPLLLRRPSVAGVRAAIGALLA